MENQSKGLKDLVALQSYIINKPICFGLFSKLVYAPTDSSLDFKDRLYGAVVRDELKELFSLNEQALEKRLAKINCYEQAVNGNLMVECCVSKDKEFVALRLMQFAQIDYQPASEVRFVQGEAAHYAANIFAL